MTPTTQPPANEKPQFTLQVFLTELNNQLKAKGMNRHQRRVYISEVKRKILKGAKVNEKRT
jgi:hypothetical protein